VGGGPTDEPFPCSKVSSGRENLGIHGIGRRSVTSGVMVV
jgi:hypothetical protein